MKLVLKVFPSSPEETAVKFRTVYFKDFSDLIWYPPCMYYLEPVPLKGLFTNFSKFYSIPLSQPR